MWWKPTIMKSRKKMWEDDEGVYAGVGIQMLADFTANTVTISRVFRNTPAEEAGLKKGDQLVRVDELQVTAETMQEAAILMRGKEAEAVEIEPGVYVHRISSADGIDRVRARTAGACP